MAADWQQIMQFTDEQLIVAVYRNFAIRKWPMLSVRIGVISGDEGHIMPFIPHRIIRKGLMPVEIGDTLERVGALLQQADDFCQTTIRKLDEERLNRMYNRDLSHAKYKQGADPRPGLGKLGDLDAMAQVVVETTAEEATTKAIIDSNNEADTSGANEASDNSNENESKEA
jgi:hypothetical protein